MKRALLIGLNYKGSEYALNCCEADVNQLALRMTKCKVETKLIYENVGIQDLLDLLDSYKSKTKKSDTFYFVYSGHGTQIPNSKESDKYDEAICLWKNGYIDLFRDDRLRDKLNEFAGQVVVIMDSCFSGGMERHTHPFPRKFVPFESIKYKNITEKIGSNPPPSDSVRLNFMFASSENEYSYEGDGNGYFTASLIKHWDNGIKYIKPLINKITPDVQHLQHPLHKYYNTTGNKKLF